ncbi:IclR family transcriptional regulator [Saccharopolyspora sp. NPDC050389]|uniref:IclR family transcriptional regulator n=1 Tax=Saccharopolyspora sp. NPDC050389 TaxID=3155516 RepID=UPI0033CF3E71
MRELVIMRNAATSESVSRISAAPGEPLPGTQSAHRALLLLRLLGSEGGGTDRGVGLGELVAASGLRKPTVHRLLTALLHNGFVEQNPRTQRYHLGPESHVLGVLAAGRFGIHRLSLPSLAKLARLCCDAAFLTVRRDDYSVCLHREDASAPIRNYALQPGDFHPLGAGAGSLAILAALDDSEVDAVIGRNADVLGRAYRLLPEPVLRRLVARTRQRGYALNDGRIFPGSWAVGVPVRDTDGVVRASLSIATTEQRLGLKRQRELAELLHREAHVVQCRLLEAAGGEPTPRR